MPVATKTLQGALEQAIESKVRSYNYLRRDGWLHDPAVQAVLKGTTFGPTSIARVEELCCEVDRAFEAALQVRLSAVMAAINRGACIKVAFDRELGEGAYVRLAGTLYDLLQVGKISQAPQQIA